MIPELSGHNVLVTGASEGIGLEVARVLGARGARVIAAARRAGPLESAVAELPGDGHVALPLDVSERDRWPPAFAAVDQVGPLHGLVTAAGILGPIGALDELAPRDIEHTLAINLVGTALALQQRCRGCGVRRRAVTFSGGGGTGPLARYDAYAASKAGVVRLTENIAGPTARSKINCVAPGFVATRMHEGTSAPAPMPWDRRTLREPGTRSRREGFRRRGGRACRFLPRTEAAGSPVG